jgi:hypothetical protein
MEGYKKLVDNVQSCKQGTKEICYERNVCNLPIQRLYKEKLLEKQSQ